MTRMIRIIRKISVQIVNTMLMKKPIVRGEILIVHVFFLSLREKKLYLPYCSSETISFLSRGFENEGVFRYHSEINYSAGFTLLSSPHEPASDVTPKRNDENSTDFTFLISYCDIDTGRRSNNSAGF